VLLVDDDEGLQTLFSAFFQDIRLNHVIVGTVKDAITALGKQKFDLLFLDLKLPDGPADDVYDVVKQQQPDCPIIIVTGYPDSAMLDRILAKGPITVLKKPLKLDQLQQTVCILARKHALNLAA
jgi:DNA-binding NtrC family response regulator